MPTLPKQVVVGHRKWKIKTWTKRQAEKRNAFGLCQYSTATLFVLLDGQDGPLQANTLIHEIEHAIWHEGELTPKDGEERIVSVSSNIRTQVIRDNPRVFDWIAEKARS